LICSCCGEEIIGSVKGPYNENQYYCEACWNNPNLFFPDKTALQLENIFRNSHFNYNDLNVLEVIDLFRANAINPNENISNAYKKIGKIHATINVIRMMQKGIPLYIGKLNAAQLLILISFDQWSEIKMSGYQREIFKEKAREIRQYLEECPIPIIPALLASFRQGSYHEIKDDYGRLEIPVIPGSIALLDGQQRTGGFEEIFHALRELHRKKAKGENEKLEKYIQLINFEIPIVFVDSCELSSKCIANNSKNVQPIDVERAFFFVINKTQKPVNPSLKDQLAYQTINAGIEGIPAIEKEKWRTTIVPIANELTSINSPLRGLINLGGITGQRKPIPLNSFITSLRPLFVLNPDFESLTFEEKKKFLINYWSSIKDLFPVEFESKKGYLLTKTVGIFSLNYLANDVFLMCKKENYDPLIKKNMSKFLCHLKGFDWGIKTSPLAFLGGKKGVKKAYEILLEIIENHNS
jgi:DGQHR domain-containing protein